MAEDSTTQLKSEKLLRKQLESKLEEHQETLSELKLDKEVLEKVFQRKFLFESIDVDVDVDIVDRVWYLYLIDMQRPTLCQTDFWYYELLKVFL